MTHAQPTHAETTVFVHGLPAHVQRTHVNARDAFLDTTVKSVSHEVSTGNWETYSQEKEINDFSDKFL